MFDIDYYITLKREENGEAEDIKKTKRRILDIADSVRKQREWKQHIGTLSIATDNNNVY